MNDPVRLPLKVVPPLQRDFYTPEPGGGPKKVFREVTREVRQELAAQVVRVRKRLAASFAEFPDVPAVARVKVRTEAIAKSHRPTAVFSSQTCPIIGAQGLGELLLSVTPEGLDRLARRIETDRTKQGIANLSTLKSVEAYVPGLEMPDDLIAKIKLFRHNNQSFDAAVEEHFYRVLRRHRVREPREIRYGRGLKVFRLEAGSRNVLESLRGYIGTQSIGPFPLYRPVRSTAITIRAATAQEFPPPDP